MFNNKWDIGITLFKAQGALEKRRPKNLRAKDGVKWWDAVF